MQNVEGQGWRDTYCSFQLGVTLAVLILLSVVSCSHVRPRRDR